MSRTTMMGRLLWAVALACAGGCAAELDYGYFEGVTGMPVDAVDASAQDGAASADADAPDAAGDDGSSPTARDGGRDSGAVSEDDASTPLDASSSEEAGAADTDAGPEPTPTELARDGWTATASVASDADVPANAVDGDPATRFSTGVAMAAGQWLQVDLGASRTVSRVVVDSSNSAGDYMRGYRIYVSDSADAPGNPVAEGANDQALATIDFEGQAGRYLRIEQTGQSPEASWWSVHELSVVGF